MTWQQRYCEAHKYHFRDKYKVAWADGHYFKPTLPKTTTANGLTQAMCNYTDWMGGVGNRIKSEGRLISKTTTTASGMTFEDKKFIKSTTKKGTADTDLTFRNGVNLKGEVKVGKDRPSDKQLDMQRRYRAAGAHYEFIHDMDQFFLIVDQLCPGDGGMLQGIVVPEYH